MVISMIVLGDHWKYFCFVFTNPQQKKMAGKSLKILDIWESQNGRVHAHMEIGESKKKLSGMNYQLPNVKI